MVATRDGVVLKVGENCTAESPWRGDRFETGTSRWVMLFPRTLFSPSVKWG